MGGLGGGLQGCVLEGDKYGSNQGDWRSLRNQEPLKSVKDDENNSDQKSKSWSEVRVSVCQIHRETEREWYMQSEERHRKPGA